MLPLQPLRSHARANPTNKPWAWRSSANRIAPRLCRFVTPGNPDSNLPGTALVRRIAVLNEVLLGAGLVWPPTMMLAYLVKYSVAEEWLAAPSHGPVWSRDLGFESWRPSQPVSSSSVSAHAVRERTAVSGAIDVELGRRTWPGTKGEVPQFHLPDLSELVNSTF